MASVLETLPRARVFAGPGDNLFGYDRLWVTLYAGYKGVDDPSTTAPPNRGHRLIIGRNGDDTTGLGLLTHILSQSSKGIAACL